MTVSEIKNKEEIRTLFELSDMIYFQQQKDHPENPRFYSHLTDTIYLKRIKAINKAIRSLVQFDDIEEERINLDYIRELVGENKQWQIKIKL